MAKKKKYYIRNHHEAIVSPELWKKAQEAAIQKRLEAVKEELTRAEFFDYKIVNDDLDNAIAELERVISGEQKKC